MRNATLMSLAAMLALVGPFTRAHASTESILAKIDVIGGDISIQDRLRATEVIKSNCKALNGFMRNEVGDEEMASTPLVAGFAADLLQALPNLTNPQVKALTMVAFTQGMCRDN